MTRHGSRRERERRLADLEDELGDPAEESSLGELTPEMREAILDGIRAAQERDAADFHS